MTTEVDREATDALTEFVWLKCSEEGSEPDAFGMRFSAPDGTVLPDGCPRALRCAIRLPEPGQRTPHNMAAWLRQLAGECDKAANRFNKTFQAG